MSNIEFLGPALLAPVAAGRRRHQPLRRRQHDLPDRRGVAPGALVMALIYALGPLSGLHINPAVTLAFIGRRVFRASWAPPYIVAQLAGAILAASAGHVQPRRRGW